MRTKDRSFWIWNVLFLFGFVGLPLGQSVKIGFVNSQQVLYGTEAGKKGMGELEQFMAEKRQEFETRNSELAKLQDEYTTKQRTLSAAALSTMESEIERKDVELRRYREDVQELFNQKQAELLQDLSNKIQVIIQEYAQQNSFSAIFMRDQNQVYVSPALDVTQDIIRIYNERFPQAAAASKGN